MTLKGVLLVSAVTVIVPLPAYAKPQAQKVAGDPLVLASASQASVVAGDPGQDEAPIAPTGAEAPQSSDIVVTGSRISRRDLVSASPIATVAQEDLARAGKVSLEATLNQLPQFTPSLGANSNSFIGSGAIGIATLNLRGLGANRNLVLLDGRRLPAANAQGVVDINILPRSIIGDVEVISGGASAVYGSDAVSGVVNFKLRQPFNGIELDAQAGASTRGDAAAQDVSLVAGFNAPGSGNVMLALNYTGRGLVTQSSRPFYYQLAPSTIIPTGVALPSGTNLPSAAVVNAVFARYGVAPGRATPTSSFGFNDDGTLFNTANGANFVNPLAGSERFVQNAAGAVGYRTGRAYLAVPLERFSAFGKAEYSLSDDIQIFAQGLYSTSKVRSNFNVNLSGAQWSLIVPATNPFIPADLRTILASRPVASAPFVVNRALEELGDRITTVRSDTFQFVAGLRGTLGGDWTWNIYGSYDRSTIDETLANSVSIPKLNELVAAPDGGASICAGGYNPFGYTNSLRLSAQCRAYVEGNTSNRTRTDRRAVEASLQGSLIELPAGPAKAAVTLDYRREGFRFTPDPLIRRGDISTISPTEPSEGSITVKEISAEILVPLLRDMTLAKSLNLTLGLRYSDYDTSGGITTYKAEGDWRPVEPVLIRGGYERAVRAPNIAELFSTSVGGATFLGVPPNAGDPCDIASAARNGPAAAQVRNLCIATGVPTGIIDAYTFRVSGLPAVVSGTRSLTPEKADTYTAGVVITPKFNTPALRRVSLSVDYYNITIKDAIGLIDGPTVVTKCYNLDGSNPGYSASNFFCSLFGRAANGSPGVLRQPYLNLGGFKTAGIDAQLNILSDLADMGLGANAGSLNFTTTISYLDNFKIQQLPGAVVQDFAGTIGTGSQPYPRWKAVTSLTYQSDSLLVGGRWRYTGRFKDVSTVLSPNFVVPGVGAYSLFDVFAEVDVAKRFKLRGGINNVGDRLVPIIGGTTPSDGGGTFDDVGRTFFAGVQAKF